MGCNIQFHTKEIEVLNFKASKHQFKDRTAILVIVSWVFPLLYEAARGKKTDMKKGKEILNLTSQFKSSHLQKISEKNLSDNALEENKSQPT